MEIDVFLTVNIDDVDCDDEQLYEYVHSQIFGGLVRWDNPFGIKNKFEKKEMLIKIFEK